MSVYIYWLLDALIYIVRFPTSNSQFSFIVMDLELN